MTLLVEHPLQPSVRLSRRAAVQLLSCGAAVALLSACGKGAATQATTATATQPGSATGSAAVKTGAHQVAAVVELTVMNWGNFDEQKVMRDAVAQFQQQYPGVRVRYSNAAGGNSYYTKLETMIAGNVPPTVFYLEPPYVPNYATKGTLAPLDPFVSASKYDLSDFFPKALDQYYWQKKLYALPRGFGDQDIYWNVGLFQKAGVAKPGLQWDDPKWTAAAFLTLAEQLTVRKGKLTTQFGYSQGLAQLQWEPWVWLFGGEVLDRSNRRCLLDQEPAMAGLQFLADLMHKYQVMPTPAYTQQEDNTSIFASGRLAMNMDIPAAVINYRKLTSIQWDVAPLPKKAKAVTSGAGVAWVMINHAAAPQQTWDLLAWLAGPHVQAMECAAGTTAPARTSVAQSRCFDDPKLPPKHMEVFLKAPGYVHISPLVQDWPPIDTLIEKQLGYLWDGSKQAKEVLPNLAAQVTHMLQKPN